MRNKFFKYPVMDIANPDAGGGGGTLMLDGVESNVKVEPTIPIINDPNPPVDPAPIVAPVIEPNPIVEPAPIVNDNTVQIEVDGIVSEFILDAQGNATKDGVIVYTADQLEGGSTEPITTDPNDIHKLISEVSGLDLLDANNQPLVFKEGVEGLAEREVFVKDTYYARGREEALDSLFDSNPDLLEMYSYKVKHGSFEGYIKQLDYSKMEIVADTTVDVLKSVYRDYLLDLGNDSKTVEKLIKLSENEETLKLDAVDALAKLKESKLAKDTLIIKQQQDQARQEQEALDNYYGVAVNAQGKLVDTGVQGSVYDKIVKTGKIGNILIPQEGLKVQRDGKDVRITRQDLFGYFYNPVQEIQGNYYTQAQIDEQKRLESTDNFLIQGIRNITGGDLKSLEETFKNVLRVKTAQKIIKMTNGKPKVVTPSANIDEQVRKGTAQVIM